MIEAKGRSAVSRTPLSLCRAAVTMVGMAEILDFKRAPEPLWREALGRKLRETREELGERLVDVADRAGISVQYLSEIERGRKDPSSEVLSAVSGALGLTVLALAERSAKRLGEGPRGPVCLAA